MEQLREKELSTYGFLGYPLLQSADILLYRPVFVPVGQDQVAHVELTREVARRFNQLYSPRHLVIGANGVESEEPDPTRAILPEPDVLLTPSPKLPGLDGRKMSKSYGNTILLSELPGDVLVKVAHMSNGGQRNPQSDPGDPEICPVGDMHRVFSKPEVVEFISNGCRKGFDPVRGVQAPCGNGQSPSSLARFSSAAKSWSEHLTSSGARSMRVPDVRKSEPKRRWSWSGM